MKPKTRALKTLIADTLGIPLRDITANCPGAVTTATVHTQEHKRLLSEHAEQLAEQNTGVIIWDWPCGCLAQVTVTDARRDHGTVWRLHHELGHDCPRTPN